MSHSYISNDIHLVFSTKERVDTISEPARLCAYMAGTLRKKDVGVHIIGGTTNHVHALIAVPATVCIADVVLAIKTNSSRRLRRESKTFAWQEGYGAFSVSASVLPRVAEYIRTQEEHHRKRDYKAEFIALIKKHRVAYDPRYVFG